MDYPTAISIDSLKCFRTEQVIHLTNGSRHAKWTIILGNNGTGKTTALRALASSGTIRQHQLLLKRSTASDAAPSSDAVLSIKPFWNTPSFIVKVAHDSPPDFDNPHRTFQLENDGKGWGQARVPSQVNPPPLFTYGSPRSFQDLDDWTPELDAQNRALLYNEEQALSNPARWLNELHHIKLANPSSNKFAKHLDAVVETLVHVLPDVSGIEFPKPKNLNQELVLFVTPYGKVPPDQLSHGYKTLMAWLIDLVRQLFHAYPRAKDPLAMPAIVLVDEIDLHLHPSWQRNLIRYLDERFKKTQFVVTAHSPLIAQSHPNANIVLLERQGNQTIVRQDLDAVKHWRLDQILQSDLFGFKTLSSPSEESIHDERRELLRKKSLSTTEKRKLTRLTNQLSELVPLGSTDTERRVFELARKVAEQNGRVE